ncbi:hypothetical protein [Pseudoalteromonas ruthenica]|nr:hypothetical protein [Pseudoalteromonas ruthenica]
MSYQPMPCSQYHALEQLCMALRQVNVQLYSHESFIAPVHLDTIKAINAL